MESKTSVFFFLFLIFNTKIKRGVKEDGGLGSARNPSLHLDKTFIDRIRLM